MKFILSALLLFGLAAFGGSRTYDDYRSGKMQMVIRGFSPIFDRVDDPLFFWGATAFNLAITAVCAIGGVITLLPLVLPR